MKYDICYLFICLFSHVSTYSAVVPEDTGQLLADVWK